MKDELAVFLVVCVLSLAFSPEQGQPPRVGHELFALLVGKSKQYEYHIHHWIYLVAIILISMIARSLSSREYTSVVAAISGAIVAEFIKYSDVLTIRV